MSKTSESATSELDELLDLVASRSPAEQTRTVRQRLPKRTWGQRLLLLVNIFSIMLTLLTVITLSYGHMRAASINRIGLDNQLAPKIGEPGSRFLNILLVGSDSAATLDNDDPIRNSREDQRLADVIIIAHLDERTGEVALLSLPRDLWLPIGGSRSSGRINQTFSTGGPAKLIRTIEENFAIPIHHYVKVDFAGFKGLVEAVGTVDIYFDAPARDWNTAANPPQSQTGFEVKRAGCVSLDPDEALAYVRSRYYQTKNEDGKWETDFSSDLGRIQRQQDFLTQLMARSIEKGARNPVVLNGLVDSGLEHVTIDQDLTPQSLLELGRTFGNFQPEQLSTYRLPVVDARVSSGDVLIPVEAQVDPVARLFAGNRFDEPETIGVSIRTEGDTHNELARDVFRNLSRKGYEITSDLPSRSRSSSDNSEPSGSDSSSASSAQILLRYSASDYATAQTVYASLDEQTREATTLVEDDGLPARIVLLSITSKTNGSPGSELAFKDEVLDGDEAQGDNSNNSKDTQADGRSANQPSVGGSCI